MKWNGLKRTSISRVSSKQKKELACRSKLKKELKLKAKGLHVAVQEFKASVLSLRQLDLEVGTITNLCASLELTLGQWLEKEEEDEPE